MTTCVVVAVGEFGIFLVTSTPVLEVLGDFARQIQPLMKPVFEQTGGVMCVVVVQSSRAAREDPGYERSRHLMDRKKGL
jgi:hypothetical protein